uniref:CD2 antigen cytoplasmic tail-binding protein 2 n=1 Tax=Panagrolaimus sp. JU765 TaxID=591449 RepID=A0AC34Q623_9BILA
MEQDSPSPTGSAGSDDLPKKSNLKRRVQEDSDDIRSSKRVRFNEGVKSIEITDAGEDLSIFPTTSLEEQVVDAKQKSQHTLDSDEETEGKEDEKVYDIRSYGRRMFESGKARFEDGQEFTPFNMDEELLEGDFDVQGNFIRKKEEIEQDTWVKEEGFKVVEGKDGSNKNVGDSMDTDEPLDVGAIVNDVKKATALLKPGQSISKFLANLNSQRLKAADERKLRFEAKKKGIPYVDEKVEKINAITELVAPAVNAGFIDQEMTKEELEKKCAELLPESVNEEEGIMWEYKIDDVIKTASTKEMIEMQPNCPAGTVARRVGYESFGDVKRLDFSLYLD